MGWFSKKKNEGKEPVAGPHAEPSPRKSKRAPQIPAEVLLDTLGQIVRAYGRNAFDITEVSSQAFQDECEQWVRHVLVGSPSPLSQSGENDTEPPQALPLAQRNWTGFQRFVVNHRRQEKQYVDSSISGLKSIVIDSLSSLRHITSGNDDSDKDVKKQLAQLRQVANGNSLDEIRRQAIRTVDMVSEAVENRQELQQKQIEYIGARIHSVRKELFDLQCKLDEDALTHVFDRGAYDETLDKFANVSSFLHEPLTLLLVDIDNLKDINERFGRPAGDEILQGVAQELIRCFPRKNDFIGRYEGDQFAVLLPDTNTATASNLAHRVLHAVRNRAFSFNNETVNITCTIGTAVLENPEPSKGFHARAEQALVRAKTNGRDQVA
ncbi:MAG: GGDEF domain-containing protein [Spartobacteria bacterium]|nr:GGDEF domain-containing protein [Spartobacteria bacterium]